VFAGWRTGLPGPVTVLQVGTAVDHLGTGRIVPSASVRNRSRSASRSLSSRWLCRGIPDPLDRRWTYRRCPMETLSLAPINDVRPIRIMARQRR
jgi:hypothetical protein